MRENLCSEWHILHKQQSTGGDGEGCLGNGVGDRDMKSGGGSGILPGITTRGTCYPPNR